MKETLMANEKEAAKNEGQANEGEGNRTAAKQYNEAQRKFVESGKVGPAAKDAEHALETEEAEELKRAEEKGLAHARPHEQKREI
jgi:hypothetical protein